MSGNLQFEIAYSEMEKLNCDKPITENECLQAIRQLANNKSPGLDGFLSNFAKHFGFI